MTQAPSFFDRLRIERAVWWTVDTLAGDLPGKRRRSIRRELRADLWAFLAVVVLEVHLFARIDGFHSGLEAAGPGDGSFTLRPLGRFGPVYETAYVDGAFDSSMLDLTPALLPLAVVLLGAFLVGGRFWRAWRLGSMPRRAVPR